MAKNFRRMFAMVLVLCMCVSAMPLQALAETTQEPIVNENGETIGQKEVTVTIVPSPSGNGTQTQTDTSWNTKETSQKDPEGSGNVITENKGETQEQETVENKGSETIVSGSSSTQEETIITDTTIQQNQPLEETETALEDMQVTGKEEEYNAPEDPDISEEGEWEKVQDSEYKKDESTVENDDPVNEEVQVKVDTEKGTSILIQVPTADSSKPYEETFNEGSKTVGGINVVENAFTDLSKEDQAAIQKLIEAAADPQTEQATIVYTVNGTKITVTASVGEDGKIIRDEQGNVVQYTVTKETEREVNLDNIHDGNGNAPVGEVEVTKQGEVTYVKPEGDYEIGTKSSTNEKGEPVTEVTEAIYAKDGKTIIGYRITTTTEITSEYTGEPMAPAQQPTPKDNKFELPEKPVVPNPKDDAKLSSTAVVTEIKNGEEVVGYTTVDNGITTTTQVTEAKDENGNVIGYTTTTVVTDASGKEISYKSDTIYGTEYSYTKSETWDPETEKKYDINVTEIRGITRTDDVTITTNGVHTNVKDVTNDVYTLVNTGTDTYFVYEGKVYAVVDHSTETERYFGSIDYSLDLDQFIGSGQRDDDDLRRSQETGTGVSHYTGRDFNKFNQLEYNGTTSINKNEPWHFSGYGLVSDFKVYANGMTTGTGAHSIKQFKLNNQSDGSIMYAYCIELGPDYREGSSYAEDVFQNTSSDNADAPWIDYNGKESIGTVGQIRSVALNGYWGTNEGVGSLQAVKDLMQRSNQFTKAEIDALTAGMAMTATQVALWEFGTTEDSKYGEFGDDFTVKNYDGTKLTTPNNGVDKELVINKLRDLLVSLANNPEEGRSQEITAENSFKEAGFVVHEKLSDGTVVNAAGEEVESDVYNTDVQFTLDISTSSLNGDLIVKVMVGDEVVGGGRLAGDPDKKDPLTQLIFNPIYPNENGVYTIPGLELAENVVIDLKLEGIQQLDDGVYILSNDTSYDFQDFVGLTTKSQNVALTMQMEFNVTDPGTADVSKSHSSWEETKDVAYKKTDKGTQMNNGTETTVKTGERKEIYGTITITETETQKTGSESEWRNRIPNPPGEPRLARIFRLNNHNLVEIPEEPVPLAAPAVTGDNSNLWIAVILMSVLCMVAINVFDKKKQHETF